MKLIHKDLTFERWFSFSLMEQLGNVGSDVIRAVRWKQKGDMENSQLAFERALELFDFTIRDPKNKMRLKEILRAREIFADYFVGDNQYEISDKFWEDYFNDFGYASAIQKGR